MSTKYRFGNRSTPHFIILTLIEWIDLLSREKYKEMLMDNLLYCVQSKGHKLHAYVIMINHLHLIVSSPKGTDLATIIRNFKRHMAKIIIKSLESDRAESYRQWIMWTMKHHGKKSSSSKYVKVWQHENHPILLDTNYLIDQRLSYLHENPVKAGICYTPEDYKYSSLGVYGSMEGLCAVSLLV